MTPTGGTPARLRVIISLTKANTAYQRYYILVIAVTRLGTAIDTTNDDVGLETIPGADIE